MTLNIHATFVEGGITYSVTADSVAAVATAVSSLKLGEAKVGDAAPAPEAPKSGKSVKADKPAASSPPAAETPKADTAASEKKADKPASAAEAPATYEKSGIAEKIAEFLGVKDSTGYADRRAKVVALLTEFGVKKGPDLDAAKFVEFKTKLEALAAAPADEDLG